MELKVKVDAGEALEALLRGSMPLSTDEQKAHLLAQLEAQHAVLEMRIRDLRTELGEPFAAKPPRQVAPEVTEVLRNTYHSIRLVNSAMAQAEAILGVRLIEPCNHLMQELKELKWCMARLNGMTELPPPQSLEVSEALAWRHRPERDRIGSLARCEPPRTPPKSDPGAEAPEQPGG